MVLNMSAARAYLRALLRGSSCVVIGAALMTVALSSTSWATSGDLWDKWTITPPSNAHVVGVWAPEDPVDISTSYFELFGVHGNLLFDGQKAKLLLFRESAKVFDLTTPNSELYLNLVGNPSGPIPSEMHGHQPFCGGYVPLANGKLLIVGGEFYHWWPHDEPFVQFDEGSASIFNPAGTSIAQCWENTDDLPDESGSTNPPPCDFNNNHSNERYYPTCTTLEDGRVLVTAGDFWTDCNNSGTWVHPVDDAGEIFVQDRWLIYDPEKPDGQKWQVDGASTFTIPWTPVSGESSHMVNYPHIKMLPYGLFWDGNDQQFAPDPSAKLRSYLWTPLANWGSSPTTISNFKQHNRALANCVVLTLDALRESVSVLLIGGGDFDLGAKLANGAEIITYEPGSSGVESSGWSLTTGGMITGLERWNANAVLLPDGKVVVIGGDASNPGPNGPAENHSCEIFTPNATHTNGTWTLADSLGSPSFPVDRGHHSIALLLPDGRVFSSGHETRDAQGQGVFGRDYQLYYPPYLFTAVGWALRDTVETYPIPPDSIAYGLPFEITVRDGDAQDIDEVALMRPCAVTHASDFSQGRVLLSHVVDPEDGSRLIVSGPKDETYAPEGYYMLFVLDDGVPSEARWVKLRRGDYVVEDGETERWAGDVWLDRDFTVQPGGTLEILPGTIVHVESDVDKGEGGIEADRIELIIQGTIKAIGNATLPINFISTTDGSPNDEDNWYGIRFDVSGCERWGYGYLGLTDPLSSIEHATISNAKYGVKIEDFAAPTLKNVQFTDIAADRHIFLDRTDVFIPAGYWPSGVCNDEDPEEFVEAPSEWLLLGGTNVVASQTQIQDAWFGNSGKVDLIPQGKFTIAGTLTNRVDFRPENLVQADSINGDSWGGVFVDWPATRSVIEHADFGFAKTPLFLLGADSVIVRNCLFHHFKERGIWVYSSAGKGFDIDSCYVYRGNLLDDHFGNEGILIDHAAHGKVRRNWVTLAGGSERYANSSGIRITHGPVFCGTSGPPESLFVHQNYVNGPGLGILGSQSLRYTGILHDWVCGTGGRYVKTYENLVENWKTFGVEFSQSSNVQVSCNRLQNLNRGVEHTRGVSLTGSSVKLRQNVMTIAPISGSCDVRTDDALNIDLGPKQFPSTKGLNQLIAPNLRHFIFEDDGGDTDSMEAQDNLWKFNGVILSDTVAVRARFSRSGGVTDPHRVWVTPLEASPTDCEGLPATNYRPFSQPPGTEQPPPAIQALVVPESGNQGMQGLDSSDREIAMVSLGAVRETHLIHAGGNPSRDITQLSLALAPANEGFVLVEIFDISGRLTRKIRGGHLASGRYRIEWNGYNENGQFAGGGIYFARVTAKGWSKTLKLVRLR